MVEENFITVYTKFKLEFYRRIFQKLEGRETSLSALEIFCVEAVYALKSPTIQEFSNFVGISSPNAAYKVNSLVKKGYITKEQSKDDKREFHLKVTNKFLEYYGLTYDYTKLVVKRISERFSKEEVETLDNILEVMHSELMNEVIYETDKLSNK